MTKPPKRAGKKLAVKAKSKSGRPVDGRAERPQAGAIAAAGPDDNAARQRAAGTSEAREPGARQQAAKKSAPKKTVSKKVVSKKSGVDKTVRRAVRSGGAALREATLDGATASVLDRLFEVVTQRRHADPDISHSARLLSRGTAKVAQKFGEEAVECLIEAVAGNSAKLIGESADVLYHLIVMWVDAGVRPGEIWQELRRREGTSGIAEKLSRGSATGG